MNKQQTKVTISYKVWRARPKPRFIPKFLWNYLKENEKLRKLLKADQGRWEEKKIISQ